MLNRQPEAFSELMEFEIGKSGYVTAVICFEPNPYRPNVHVLESESEYQEYFHLEDLKRELLLESLMLQKHYRGLDYLSEEGLKEELGEYYLGIYETLSGKEKINGTN
ncbi:hypothetical protein VPHK460_0187 [Vibrio phage K460]